MSDALPRWRQPGILLEFHRAAHLENLSCRSSTALCGAEKLLAPVGPSTIPQMGG